LAFQPEDADTHNNLGTVLHRQGSINEAIASYRRAIELKQDHVGAQNNLGLLLADQGLFDESLECFQKALAAEPNSAVALTHVGHAWQQLGDSDQAIRYLRRALELDPDYQQAHNNLGVLLHEQGDFEVAAKSFERALELQPDSAAAHVNQSYLMLLKADFEQGWREFEWRWKYKPFTGRAPKRPAWSGSQIAGRTILLHAEQGFGDTIQFVRYAPLVKQLGANVIMHCPTKLLPLLRGCPGIDQLIGDDEPVPPYDEHASLLSLPHILKTNLNSIPANVPYLHADAKLVEDWRKRLAAVNGFRIGINWRGRGGQRDFRLRDMPLELFAGIADISSVSLISLQRGEGREQLMGSAERNRMLDLGEDVDDAAGAFMDTAAIMENLDMVISSDTAIAHLAGALGLLIWVGLPYVPNWRWLLNRADSPWYPTMRLFRQRSPGDWKGVFNEMKAALLQRLSVT
jgi:tetratricopeptide (TPR) repeat protein